jgi:hypothetical protein
LQAEVAGKLDVGPAFVHIDILESGRTVKRMDMWAVRGDLSFYVYKGLYIKPVVIYGNGGAAKGGLFNSATSLGYCIPVHERLLLSPAVGFSYSHLWTKIDYAHMTNLRENFKSWAPFLSLDLYYTFAPSWRVGLGVQYAWSRTSTSIQHLVKNQKSSPEGFAYSFLLEHDLSDQWSLNIGAAYNLSLTKEKHGLRGTGFKAAVVRWF